VSDPDEECDDSNLTEDDGCDSNCTITRCDNGVITAGEECDDGDP
jgi:cysteine-rich repeat protein